MTIKDALRGWVWDFLLPGETLDYGRRERVDRFDQWTSYYNGIQRQQLKTKPDHADDNLTINLVSLIVDRSVSMLLGGGVTFTLPDEGNQEFIEETWEANRQNLLLYDAAQNGAIYGTGFLKLIPYGVESKRNEDAMLTRLVVLDPRWMDVKTLPEDVGTIVGYEMRYNVGDIARKEVIQPFGTDAEGRILSWSVINYEANRSSGGRWAEISNVVWEYEFPPVVQWKNLPRANDVWGRSDIEDVMNIQDRINFVAGNISKVIRYHAHPKTWGRGAGLGNRVSWGPDEIVLLNGPDSVIQNLEMQSDLTSSRAFYDDLKEVMMEITRTVDLSSMKDRIGALTNFGLRVLYNDALDKNDTKRDSFGEALVETNHRLLVLDNRPGDAGRVNFPDPLPSNVVEDIQVDGFLLDRGLASNETIAENYGIDYDSEADRIANDRASETSIGAMLLSQFNRGTDVVNRARPASPLAGEPGEEEGAS